MSRLPVVVASLLLAAPTLAQDVPDMVLAKDAANYIGEYAMVCGVVSAADYRQDVRGAPTYLSFGQPYPNQDFTVVIWGRERDNFEFTLEDLDGYKACAYGQIKSHRNKPQITISQPEQLNFKAPGD